MILLKADTESKTVFQRLIKTMGLNVVWNEVFIVINNNLILAGSGRSMMFHFDDKRLTTNIVDIPINEDAMQEMEGSRMLMNSLTLVLYAFGKWGAISGLTVEKDYAQLNQLFRSILKEIDVEPSFRNDNFRFFKEGVQITFEDVIQEILNLEEKGEAEKQEAEKGEEEKREYELGLWHNVKWVTETHAYEKAGEEERNQEKPRLGNNFYTVDYKCPGCGERLYMVLYPVNQEFLIETDEENVYIARAYTCSTCRRFYTPRPGKLLQEGDSYVLGFEEDVEAYGDYLELLGASGSREANYKFNEYEWERNRKDQPPEEPDPLCGDLDAMTTEELSELEEKLETGFYSEREVKKYNIEVDRRLGTRRQREEKIKGREVDPEEEQEFMEGNTSSKSPLLRDKEGKAEKQERAMEALRNFSYQSSDELKDMIAEGSRGGIQTEVKEEAIKDVKKGLNRRLIAKYDALLKNTEGMSLEQLTLLKSEIRGEQALGEEQISHYLEELEGVLYRKEEKTVRQKAEACKDKSYLEIDRVMGEIERGNSPEHVKESVLEFLREIRTNRGTREAEYLIAHLPVYLDEKQYRQFQEKLEQYQDINRRHYLDLLEKKRDLGEKQEISVLLKRAPKKTREDLLQICGQILEHGFAERNTAPFIEKINDKIYALDKAAIDKICPDLYDITFEQGLEAYEKIEAGIYLPELKENTLGILDKRLTKIKMDECEQLVAKLRNEVEKKIQDTSKLYFYEVREMKRSGRMEKALSTYAAARSKYEFPILICDGAFFPGGKEGFVVTPDHIYYNKLFSAGSIAILEVEGLAGTKFRSRNLGVYQRGGNCTRLPNPVKSGDRLSFSAVLNDFVDYLQEKPESRSISYMAEETHRVKCCYRCGYTYKGGNICPKCGSKANH